MKPLSEMTLAEFINQRAQWDLMTAAERAAWYDERDRRQRMLEAAEAIAKAASRYCPLKSGTVPASHVLGFKAWNVQAWQAFNGKTLSEWNDELSRQLAAYQSAKGDR